jgi:CRP-like cAMP-binding protein/uncharacterized membrane protein YdbT with pleckstrin-like domain
MVQQLRRIARLSLLDDAALADLATVVTTEQYSPGEVICEEGESGDKLYAIEMGQVVVKSVVRGQQVVVTYLFEGDVFGERALIEDLPRTATITAETTVHLLCLRRGDYQRLVQKHPSLKRILVGPEVIPLLRQVPLFGRLSEEELTALSEHVGVVFYPPGRHVVEQGDMGTTMYVVSTGELVAYQLDERGRSRPVKVLKEGHAFGETSLLIGEPRDATVITKMYTELCYIHKASFDKFLAAYPNVWNKLLARPEVERKRKAKHFPGQKPDEIVEIMDSKHWIAFFGAVARPTLLLALVGVALFVVDAVWLGPAGATLDLGGLLGALTIFWAVIAVVVLGWHWIDWRNDYHIVTTQRVIHIENVLWRATSREEVPIQQVQNVRVERDLWGGVLDYGHVRITTAAVVGGTMNLEYVYDPEDFQHAIFEQIARAKYRATAAERAELRRTLRQAMGFSVFEEEAKGSPPPAKAKRLGWRALLTQNPLAKRLRKTMTESGLATFLRRPHLPHMEIRQNNQVIWRKHWGVLLTVTYRPLVVCLLVLVLILLVVLGRLGWFALLELTPPLFSAVLLALGVGLVPALGWLVWEVEDWRNDLYIVTDTHIIDIERTPLLLRESKRQASLDNIQNTKASTKGFLAGLFKLGDVTIETAGAGTFTFGKVRNPSKVQAEVDKRRDAYRARLRQQQVEQQRADIAKWFSVYYDIVGEEEARARRQASELPPWVLPEGSEEQDEDR